MLDSIFSLPVLSAYSGWVLFALRVFLGITLIYYGKPKIKNLKKTAKDFEGMGFKPGWFWGGIMTFIEFFGGIAIIIGLYVWVFALLHAGTMATGMLWKIVKKEMPFSNWSYDILLLGFDVVLLTFGPGALALLT